MDKRNKQRGRERERVCRLGKFEIFDTMSTLSPVIYMYMHSDHSLDAQDPGCVSVPCCLQWKLGSGGPGL